MLILARKLFALPVVTESGVRLGFVRDIEFDVEAHAVRAYLVGHKLFGKEKYRIAPHQVRMITLKNIVVDDGVATLSNEVFFKTKTTTPQMVMNSEEK